MDKYAGETIRRDQGSRKTSEEVSKIGEKWASDGLRRTKCSQAEAITPGNEQADRELRQGKDITKGLLAKNEKLLLSN